MSDLYLIKKNESIEDIEKAPFLNETRDLEDFILKNERIIGTVILLNRQIEIPPGLRIDLWGIDLLDYRPIILELKNVIVGLEIIPQILPYYQFLKQNPDTLKYKALTDDRFLQKVKEQDETPDAILSRLENDPKVLLVAPGFKTELISTVEYLNLDIEIIKIARYKLNNNEYIIHVDRPDYPESTIKQIRVMEEYDWEKYKILGISNKKINEGKKVFALMQDIVRDENLSLNPIFRKLYIPFQDGNINIFWIDFNYTSHEKGEVFLVFKMDKEPAKSEYLINEKVKTKWFSKYKQWGIYYDDSINKELLIKIVKASYEYVVGAKPQRN